MKLQAKKSSLRGQVAIPGSKSHTIRAVAMASLAEGASLHIIKMPGKAFCLQCLDTVPVTQRYDSCPVCGSYHLQITQGEEMRIKELEVA